ncbi:hypothetical protein LAZ67_3005166, partial [Cordylochernes scorpioides]
MIEWKDDTNLQTFKKDILDIKSNIEKTYCSLLTFSEFDDEVYFSRLMQYKDNLRNLVANINKVSCTASSSKIDDLNQSTTSKIELPKFNLPSFSGDVNEWLSFKQLFSLSIDSNTALTDSQKLQYLQSAVTGDSERLIRKHHTLLHSFQPEPLNTTSIEAPIAQSSVSCFLSDTTKPNETILLSTAIVRVRAENGSFHPCRALIDTGSQRSLITENCREKLNLPVKKSQLAVFGIGNQPIQQSASETFLQFKPHFSDRIFKISSIILDHIAVDLPNFLINRDNWPHLKNTLLADPNFDKTSPIDSVIGADLAPFLYTGKLRFQNYPGPTTCSSKLGWILSGNVSSSETGNSYISLCSTSQGDDNLRKFFELESVPAALPLTKEEKSCGDIYDKNFCISTDGRYSVGLPFKSVPNLGDSRQNAMKRFLALERKLHKSSNLLQQYKDFMMEYLSLNHMELIPKNERDKPSDKCYYIPHHCVLREQSSTTKLRVVFDASCKTSNNYSLNDFLHTGPKLQHDIFNILVKFRTNPIAFTGDIEKMYRQIKVNSSDLDFQRIFWRNSPLESLLEYRLLTVTYGMSCAPYLAIRTLMQLATDKELLFPEVSKIMKTDFYVDDLLSGATTIEEAKVLIDDIRKILLSGGFCIRKWMSNVPEVLSEVPEALKAHDSYEIGDNSSVKILGINWNPSTDNFTITVNSLKDELHGFCDASESAYSSVVYMKSRFKSGQVQVTLIAAKTKVAPLKATSIPRLELCAALLLSNLYDSICSSLLLQIDRVILWTDSQIVLCWIKSESKHWKPFVGNRIAEIQRLTLQSSWYYVSTKDNPADCASRGITSSELVNHSLWWNGPDWLSNSSLQDPLPITYELPKEVCHEKRQTVPIVHFTTCPILDFIFKFSTFRKLSRVTAWLLRFIHNARHSNDKIKHKELSSNELDNSIRTLIQIIQSSEFKTEIQCCNQSKVLPSNSKLLSLNPFIDSSGILRVGGRLRKSNLQFNEKHPIILQKPFCYRIYCSTIPASSSKIDDLNQSTTSKIELPKFNLPSFSGDVNEWLSFKQLFSLSIDSNTALTDSQKLQYLQSAVTGDSERLIRDNWPHLKNTLLADPNFDKTSPIDLVIGADLAPFLYTGKLRFQNYPGPTTCSSKLGWILSGNVSSSETGNSYISLCSTSQGDDNLRKFFELESVPAALPLTKEEKSCGDIYDKNFCISTDGRYSVGLPFKSVPNLGDSRQNAMKRFLALERKLHKSSNLLQQYKDFMMEYLSLNHMELIPKNERDKPSDKCYYIPHHCVLREQSSTTKLRVVFDASCKTSNNYSLNDFLHTGPKLQHDIFNILVKFRTNPIAFTGDIEKMYRQIKVNSSDLDFQRIFWRNSPLESLLEYRLLTVTYGMSCAPYLAIRTLMQLATDKELLFPEVSKIMKTDFYVDDLLSGATTIEEAKVLIDDIRKILLSGGFCIRKWMSNVPEVLSEVPEALKAHDSYEIGDNSSVKILGINWNPSTDNFTITVNSLKDVYSKRQLLSDISRIYDPLGWLSPVIISFKILFQTLWKQDLDWNDPLSESLCSHWRRVKMDLAMLNHIKIPRYISCKGLIHSLELHGFCDASESAYSSVVYMKSRFKSGQVQVTLIAAKTKVAPLKATSIPRLELCAALLLSNLYDSICSSLLLQIDQVILWTDSQIVLCWIKSESKHWKPFVGNRIAEIQRLTLQSSWYYVSTKDNPADCASRGITSSELVNHSLWWNGPDWLSNSSLQDPLPITYELPKEDLDQKMLDHMMVADAEEDTLNCEIEEAEHYSDTFITLERKVRELIDSDNKSDVKSLGSSNGSLMAKSYKLPKIEIRKFDGELINWLPFWAQFEKIHEDTELHDADKFHYLVQSMQSNTRARELIESYPQTAENYAKAVQALKQRYGQKDLLVEIYVRELLKLMMANVKTPPDERRSVAKLYDKLETQLRSLESLGVDTKENTAWLFPMIESCLPEDVLKRSGRGRRRLLARRGFEGSSPKEKLRNKFKQNSNIPTAAGLFSAKEMGCLFCENNHQSKDCITAQSMPFKDKRAKIYEKRCCLKCLKPGHLAKACKRTVQCNICAKGHYVLLCPDLPCNRKEKTHVSEVVQSALANQQCTRDVTLMTLMVNIMGNNGYRRVRALLDPGSQKSYILESTALEVKLKPIGNVNIAHSLFGGTQTETKCHKVYTVALCSNLSELDTLREFEFLGQDIICGEIPRTPKGAWLNELKGSRIWLSDLGRDSPKIELLIGSDIYGSLLSGRVKQLENGLTAIETHLGWTICGPSPKKDEQSDCSSLVVISMHSRNMSVDYLWDLETIGIKDPRENLTKLEEDKIVHQHFLNTVHQLEDGRFCVGLPWLGNQEGIPSNRHIAERRLFNTTRKLRAKCIFSEYDRVFQEWLAEGVIEKVSPEDLNRNCHYLPHHPVVKANSNTTKIRPVFDASCKDKGNLSLNDCLASGPNVIEQIPAILLKFREKAIGVIADIRKAFLQIEVKEEDRDYLRFLWWKNNHQIQVFRHKRVVFGVTCSPYLLGAVILHHLKGVSSEFGALPQKLMECLYIDNCVTSVDTEAELVDLVEKSTEIFAKAKMDLRMWQFGPIHRVKEVYSRLPPSVDIERSEEASVLGMKWNLLEDTLNVTPKFGVIINSLSKRDLLSHTQQIFDPIGFLAPVLLPAKLLIQQAWTVKTDWDEPLPSTIQENFMKWYSELDTLADIKIPRRVGHGIRAHWSLHIFCDASQSAYAAAAFLRCPENKGVSVQLLMAKSRLGPLKKTTIPRMELLACMLGVRLSRYITESLNLAAEPVYYWTDSTTALSWIKTNRQWGTFVNNRVKEICNTSGPNKWFYVPGSLNPADLPSRGCSVLQLKRTRWWEGPEWLKQPQDHWPKQLFHSDRTLVNLEIDRQVLVTTHARTEVMPWFERFSNFTKIVRINAWIRRFIRNTQKLSPSGMHSLQLSELEDAEKGIWKTVQQQVFSSRGDSINGLMIIRDDFGLIRIKSKLIERDDEYSFRYPILLPTKHHVVTCLIREFHLRHCHAGVQILSAKLRENYWILNSRRSIRSVVSQCAKCRRFSSKPVKTAPIHLPLDRVRDATAFEILGVDLAGPLYLKNKTKAWIVLFTCAVFRAIHLELVTSLSTEAFIQALRRFIARRGRPTVIYSDNGTNFVGANNALKALNWKKIVLDQNLHKISWKFIPPTAAWWGGWWERLIRSIKDLLVRILGHSSVYYEEMSTILCDVEATINSRPLTYIHEDFDSLIPLSPSMFLHDSKYVGVPDLDKLDSKKFQDRYRHCQRLREALRSRFRSEYLGQLVQKANERTPKLSVGDVVIVKVEDKRRLHWPMARIVELFSGRDGHSRVAKVRTKLGTLIRPVQKLYPLEVSSGDPILRSKGDTTIKEAHSEAKRTRCGRV